MLHQKFVILISGPTGSGKSALALELGNHCAIEIVNADIGSFYTHLTIGTAKPDWQSSKIPHHFFDVIDDAKSWTAPQFREKLAVLIEEIWQRGAIPVVVGGSAFYIQSFFYKNHTLALPTEELIEELEERSTDLLFDELYAVDAQRAEKIGPSDRYRLVRALAIWYTQNQKPSDFEQQFEPLAPFYFATVFRDRDQLYTMINDRVDSMMENGWLREVQSLLDDPEWTDFLLKKKI